MTGEPSQVEDRFTEHTLLYLRLGFALLPIWGLRPEDNHLMCGCGDAACTSPGKHPIGSLAPQGVHSATTDPSAINRWRRVGPANLAIATGEISGIFALDVDPRHDGDETLRALERTHAPLPESWRFQTGGGGEHILFRHPDGHVPSRPNALGPGLDVKADGGYIVAPPSRHLSGRTYEISVDHHPDDVPLAEPPAWLIAALTGGAVEAKRARPTAEWRELTRHEIKEGRRNDALTRLIGHLLRKGVDPHVALDLLLGFNVRNCRPSLPEREVAQIVANINRREQRRRAYDR